MALDSASSLPSLEPCCYDTFSCDNEVLLILEGGPENSPLISELTVDVNAGLVSDPCTALVCSFKFFFFKVKLQCSHLTVSVDNVAAMNPTIPIYANALFSLSPHIK